MKSIYHITVKRRWIVDDELNADTPEWQHCASSIESLVDFSCRILYQGDHGLEEWGPTNCLGLKMTKYTDYSDDNEFFTWDSEIEFSEEELKNLNILSKMNDYEDFYNYVLSVFEPLTNEKDHFLNRWSDGEQEKIDFTENIER